MFVATTADREWNDWPQGRLYVPLFRQLAAYFFALHFLAKMLFGGHASWTLALAWTK